MLFFGKYATTLQIYSLSLLPPYLSASLSDGEHTGAWKGIDTLANCNKVEHEKI